MPKKKPKSKTKDDTPPVLGRLGAEQWIAVRQKSGAGPDGAQAAPRHAHGARA